jgi:AraC family transcriptional regulator
MDESLRIRLEAPRIERRGPIRFAGLREGYTGNNFMGIGGQWQRFRPYIGNVPGQLSAGGYGLHFDMIGMMEGGVRFYFMTAVEVSDAAGLPKGFRSVQTPARRYVVFPHLEHAAKVRNTVNTVWFNWFPSSGYEVLRGGLELPDVIERCGERFDAASGMGGMEVWFPVKG